MMLRWPALLFPALLLCSCAHRTCESERPFRFQRDTFAHANELVWEYGYDANGKWKSHRREPKPDYTHHCFVVARSALEFFQHARFEPSLPKQSPQVYQNLIEKVLRRSTRTSSSYENRIIIPGYANLREFSHDYEAEFKKRSGGAWQSYLQRGHWRMLTPFTRGHQQRTVEKLQRSVQDHCPVIVHLVRFPRLTINHAVVLFEVEEKDLELVFSAYDPNNPDAPVPLRFDKVTRTFTFPQTDYFVGGRVDVYQVYHSFFY